MTPVRTKVQGLAGRLAAATAMFAAIALGLAAVLLVTAGPAYRSGLLALGTAFDTLRSGVVVALVAGGRGRGEVGGGVPLGTLRLARPTGYPRADLRGADFGPTRRWMSGKARSIGTPWARFLLGISTLRTGA